MADINAMVDRLAKFARAELKEMRRRTPVERGRSGDRALIIAYLCAFCGFEKLPLLSADEALVFPESSMLPGPLIEDALLDDDLD